MFIFSSSDLRVSWGIQIFGQIKHNDVHSTGRQEYLQEHKEDSIIYFIIHFHIMSVDMTFFWSLFWAGASKSLVKSNTMMYTARDDRNTYRNTWRTVSFISLSIFILSVSTWVSTWLSSDLCLSLAGVSKHVYGMMGQQEYLQEHMEDSIIYFIIHFHIVSVDMIFFWCLFWAGASKSLDKSNTMNNDVYSMLWQEYLKTDSIT